MANKEIFKDFDLRPDISISSHWRLFDKKLGKFRIVAKTCTQWICYYYANLKVAWKNRRFWVHRLVAYAFLWLDIFNPKSIVLHLDDDGTNNNVENLRVWTHKDNMDDSVSKGRRNPRKWEKHYRCKLTNDQIEEIKLLYSKWWLHQRRIWEIYWVWQDHISRILNNKVRKI